MNPQLIKAWISHLSDHSGLFILLYKYLWESPPTRSLHGKEMSTVSIVRRLQTSNTSGMT